MTKEDILSDHLQKYLLTTADIYNGTTVIKVCIERAMEEYADIKAKEVSIEFLIWKSTKGYYAQGATQRTTNDDPIWIRQENQLVFSNPISTNKLFDLYINSKQQ